MSTAKTTSGVVATSPFHAANVRVSPRVNEKLPALDQILSAHDVARLTRRNRWVLYALSFLGRFPRKQRFRGHSIGWDRVEILEWLTPPKPNEPKAPTTGTRQSAFTTQPRMPVARALLVMPDSPSP